MHLQKKRRDAGPKALTSKNGLLLAVFGASNLMARRALDDFDRLARRRFPLLPVRWAFTSSLLRSRLADGGQKSDSVKKALCRMGFERFTQVAVQPLHLIAGIEYETVCEECREAANSDGPAAISLGRPLICDECDAERVAEALFAHLPPERGPEDVVICVGHGSRHDAARSGYAALAAALARRDPLVLLDSLADPGDSLPEQVIDQGAKRVWLLPLLALVGKHAQTDIAGPGPTSRRSLLEAAGLTCVPVLKGTLEYEGFASLWLERLAEAASGLENEKTAHSNEHAVRAGKE